MEGRHQREEEQRPVAHSGHSRSSVPSRAPIATPSRPAIATGQLQHQLRVEPHVVPHVEQHA
jgi:hypothetical protein